ncbi:glutamate racemase [Saxibacter everestensis]|uniref:Glutamate racemase n=1 Tax=Saxibacter everestensis TaxID=2909229 RepID=A0ABY8QPA0_9MICO|nr:glutamate racemase [Brevibacteriaceae bacterium ZFBP1038]
MAANASIGVFDSGVGGLTVARAIIDLLPHESVRYVGDTKYTPYGPRPLAQVRARALEVMDHLVDDGVKMLVIACNSASAAVLRDARERYECMNIPVVEVILPAVRRAVAATRTGRIGVIGTEATITSMAYNDAFAAAPNLQITSQACPRFVEFVENGVTSGPALLTAAAEYLAPVRAAGVDTLVLGCTHYPLLAGAISLSMGDEVTLVSSAEETAKDVYRVLVRQGLERDGANGEPLHEFLATGDTEGFRVLARRFLGPEVRGVISTRSTVDTGALSIVTRTAHDQDGGALRWN